MPPAMPAHPSSKIRAGLSVFVLVASILKAADAPAPAPAPGRVVRAEGRKIPS